MNFIKDEEPTTVRVMKKILLIDDTKHLLDEMADILTMEGYEVFTASNAYLGLSLVILNKPDLIVTDIMMREMDGYGLISNVKTSPETSCIPIIVLSSKSEKEDIRKALMLNADIYLKKPCSADELIGSVDLLLKSA